MNREKTQPKSTAQAFHDTASRQDAERRCDFIALHGWAWWKQVVEDAENKAKNTAREEN